MKARFDRMAETLVRKMGEQWTASIDDEALTFYAILDDEEQVTMNNMGRVKDSIRALSITALTSVTKRFNDGQVITDSNENTYQVRECLRTGDGALSLCYIVETSNNDC